MFASRWCVATLALALAAVGSGAAASVDGNRVLVLAGADKGAEFSGFLGVLEARGYKVSVKNAEESDASLFRYGEAQFEHLVNLAPEAGGFGGLTAHLVVDFINKGGNVLLAGGANVNGVVKDLSAELGVEFDEELPSVIDHFAYAGSAAEKDHSVVLAERAGHLRTGEDKSSILFQGPSLSFSSPIRPHFLLTARPTAFVPADAAAVTSANVPKTIGRKTVLVAGLQARNQARVAIAASASLFSDALLQAAPSDFALHGSASSEIGNAKYVNDLIAWNFRESGVLRVKAVSHHKQGSAEQPETYRIKDDIVYKIQLEEWTGETWAPFVAKDVQLEVTMLNPYLRLTLNVSSEEPNTLVGKFRLPDVYGVFTFRVEYESAGKTAIRTAFQIPVLPFRHNEYERFIPAAFPYYAGAFSMMASFWLFSWLWLYHAEPAAKAAKTKAN